MTSTLFCSHVHRERDGRKCIMFVLFFKDTILIIVSLHKSRSPVSTKYFSCLPHNHLDMHNTNSAHLFRLTLERVAKLPKYQIRTKIKLYYYSQYHFSTVF